MQAVQRAHEVVAARDLLRRHEQDLELGVRLALQRGHERAALLIVLRAAEVAAGDARLLQVEHLRACARAHRA